MLKRIKALLIIS